MKPLSVGRWLAKIENLMTGAAKQACLRSQIVAERGGYVIYFNTSTAARVDQGLANTIRQQLALDKPVSFKSTRRPIALPIELAESKDYIEKKVMYGEFRSDENVIAILEAFNGSSVTLVSKTEV